MIPKISNPKPIVNSASSKFVQKAKALVGSVTLIPNILLGIVRPAQAVELMSLKIPQTRIEQIATSSAPVKACQQERNNLESQIKTLQLQQKLLPDQIADIKANIEEDKELLKELQAKPNPTNEDTQEIERIKNRQDQGGTILGTLNQQLRRGSEKITALQEELTRACSMPQTPTPADAKSL